MIATYFLDLRDREEERNSKPVKESEIEEVKLFGKFDPKLVKVRKNLLEGFKQKLIQILKKYHECFT